MRTVSIDTSKVIGTPNPKMWGVFYEEINHAGEGGLYAELIRNRSFADSNYPENTIYIPERKNANGETRHAYFRTKQGWGEDIDFSDPLPAWSVKADPEVTSTIEKTTENPRNPECPEQLKLFCDGRARLVNSGYWGINAKKQSYNGFLLREVPALRQSLSVLCARTELRSVLRQ